MNSQEIKKLEDLTYKVGELSGKINQMDKNIDNRFLNFKQDLDKITNHQEARINKLEEIAAKMQGKTAGIAATISIIVSIIGLIIAFWKLK